MKSGRRLAVSVMVGVAVIAAGVAVRLVWNKPGPQPAFSQQEPARPTARSKVLFVDSYHRGYPWSEGITQGGAQDAASHTVAQW